MLKAVAIALGGWVLASIVVGFVWARAHRARPPVSPSSEDVAG